MYRGRGEGTSGRTTAWRLELPSCVWGHVLLSPLRPAHSTHPRPLAYLRVSCWETVLTSSHVGLGLKCAKEVATAIRGAIINAKLNIIPVRRGYWGSHIAEPHTVPCKVSGKAASVMCRLIPARALCPPDPWLSGRQLTHAARGTGIVAAPASKRMLQMAGIQDCYSMSSSPRVNPFCLLTSRQPSPRVRPLPRVTS